MKKHYLQTSKTARYFTHNNLWDMTQTILIVLHGYAQTAENIIENFAGLNDRHYIIAPEGLNRFYSRGVGGTPVASWMTSLERDSEIADYIHYLDYLYEHLQLDAFEDAKIVVLGFSQGVSTGSRWVQATQNRVDAFIMVAGEVAVEMQNELPDKMKEMRKAYLLGDADSLVTPAKLDLMHSLLGEATVFEKFEGSHEINAACMEQVVKVIDRL